MSRMLGAGSGATDSRVGRSGYWSPSRSGLRLAPHSIHLQGADAAQLAVSTAASAGLVRDGGMGRRLTCYRLLIGIAPKPARNRPVSQTPSERAPASIVDARFWLRSLRSSTVIRDNGSRLPDGGAENSVPNGHCPCPGRARKPFANLPAFGAEKGFAKNGLRAVELRAARTESSSRQSPPRPVPSRPPGIVLSLTPSTPAATIT